MATLIFHGQFHDADGLGLTGLTVTCDVYRTALADGTTSQVVTGGSASETGGGIYRYRYASADLSSYHYVANMKTTSTDVAQKHVAALGLVVPDALVSSRLAPTDAGRTLDIAATGEASANVTYSAGVALGGPLAEASDLPSVAGLALEATAQAILEDTGTTLPAAIAGIGAGGGLYSETITIKDTLDNPLDGVLVHVATDSAFANIVRSGYTNNMGQVVLNFDTTGTYYGRAEIAGYGISVFDVEVTA